MSPWEQGYARAVAKRILPDDDTLMRDWGLDREGRRLFRLGYLAESPARYAPDGQPTRV